MNIMDMCFAYYYARLSVNIGFSPQEKFSLQQKNRDSKNEPKTFSSGFFSNFWKYNNNFLPAFTPNQARLSDKVSNKEGFKTQFHLRVDTVCATESRLCYWVTIVLQHVLRVNSVDIEKQTDYKKIEKNLIKIPFWKIQIQTGTGFVTDMNNKGRSAPSQQKLDEWIHMDRIIHSSCSCLFQREKNSDCNKQAILVPTEHTTFLVFHFAIRNSENFSRKISFKRWMWDGENQLARRKNYVIEKRPYYETKALPLHGQCFLISNYDSIIYWILHNFWLNCPRDMKFGTINKSTTLVLPTLDLNCFKENCRNVCYWCSFDLCFATLGHTLRRRHIQTFSFYEGISHCVGKLSGTF